MDIKELFKPKPSKRQEIINKTGRDPRTGLTARHLVLGEEIRPRGGKRSKRRTTLVWRPAERYTAD